MGEIPTGLHNSAAEITGPPAGEQLGNGKRKMEREERRRGIWKTASKYALRVNISFKTFYSRDCEKENQGEYR